MQTKGVNNGCKGLFPNSKLQCSGSSSEQSNSFVLQLFQWTLNSILAITILMPLIRIWTLMQITIWDTMKNSNAGLENQAGTAFSAWCRSGMWAQALGAVTKSGPLLGQGPAGMKGSGMLEPLENIFIFFTNIKLTCGGKAVLWSQDGIYLYQNKVKCHTWRETASPGLLKDLGEVMEEKSKFTKERHSPHPLTPGRARCCQLGNSLAKMNSLIPGSSWTLPELLKCPSCWDIAPSTNLLWKREIENFSDNNQIILNHFKLF